MQLWSAVRSVRHLCRGPVWSGLCVYVLDKPCLFGDGHVHIPLIHIQTSLSLSSNFPEGRVPYLRCDWDWQSPRLPLFAHIASTRAGVDRTCLAAASFPYLLGSFWSLCVHPTGQPGDRAGRAPRAVCHLSLSQTQGLHPTGRPGEWAGRAPGALRHLSLSQTQGLHPTGRPGEWAGRAPGGPADVGQPPGCCLRSHQP